MAIQFYVWCCYIDASRAPQVNALIGVWQAEKQGVF